MYIYIYISVFKLGIYYWIIEQIDISHVFTYLNLENHTNN